MAFSGYPDDKRNNRTKECGCEYARLAAVGQYPEGWYLMRACDEHRTKS